MAPLTNKEKRTFEKGVDMDSALSGIEQGYSRYMLNCNIDEGVNVTNIKGNLVAEFEEGFTFFRDNPDYDYKCIGSIEDPIFNKIYFFVVAKDLSTSPSYSSFIFEYDVASGIVYVVCDENWSDILLFEFDELITGISIIFKDTTIPLLYWGQRAGLRKINVYKAKNIFDTGGYTERTLQEIELIKYPPRFKPEITQITDRTKNFNNINQQYFQFAYVYIYDDYEESVGSPISDVNTRIYNQFGELRYAFPSDKKGYLITDKNYDNCIELTLNSGPSIVEKVKIYYRQKTSDNGSAVDFDWYIYDTLEKSIEGWDNNTDYVYKFYNDKVPSLVTQEVANRLFSNVPLAANANAIAENSMNYVGGVKEGYNLVTTDITAEPKYNKVGVFCDFTSGGQFDQNLGSNLVSGYGLVLPGTPPEVDDVLRIGLDPTLDGVNYYYLFYQIKDEDLLDYPNRLNQSIVDGINQSPFYLGVHAVLEDDGSIVILNEDSEAIADEVYLQTPTLSNFAQLKTFREFKTGQIHNLGIFYRDAGGRMSPIQPFTCDLPFFTQAPFNELIDQELFKFISGYPSILVTINHIPPIWADRYSIAYGSPAFGNFYQMQVSSMVPDGTNFISVAINFFQTYPLKDSTFLSYSFSPGDKIRFIGVDQSSFAGSVLSEPITGINFGNNGLVASVLSSIAYDDINYGASWQSHILPSTIVTVFMSSVYEGKLMTIGSTGVPNRTEVFDNDYVLLGAVSIPLPTTYYTDVLLIGNRQLVSSLIDGIFLSDSFGAFATSNTGLSNLTPNCFYVDGTDIYVGCYSGGGFREVFKSTDQGTSWAAFSSVIGGTAVISLTSNGTTFYAGTLGDGVYISVAGGNWSQINTGLTDLNVYSMVKMTFDSVDYIFAVTGDGVFRTSDNANWELANTGIDVAFITNKILVQGTTLVASSVKVTSPSLTNSGEAYVYVSPDAGQHWFKWTDISSPDVFLKNSFTGFGSNTNFDFLIESPVLSEIDATHIKIPYNYDLYQSYLDSGNIIYVEIIKTATQSTLYNELVSYEIGDAGLSTRYHKGNVQDQEPITSPLPAIVDLVNGNTFFRKRPVAADASYFFEDPNYIDTPSFSYVSGSGDAEIVKNQSAVTNLGRPNAVNKNYKEIVRENTIWHSEQFIPESNINGLSSYPDGQFRDYGAIRGSIQKFIATDRSLKVLMEIGCGWIAINQEVSATGAQQVFTLETEKVLTQMIYYAEKRGVGKHPESVIERAGVVYGTDPITGCIFRISRDGFTIISDIKNSQGNYLVRQSIYEAIKANTGNFPAGFNPRRDSAEFNLGGIVMVWNEEKNSWVGGRSYDAECFSSSGVDLISFYNGRLYLHEANPLRNNFYGVQYSSKLWAPGNWQDFKKIYKAIAMRSETAWPAYEILNDMGQRSIIDRLRFIKREGMWYAAFRRDMNSVNVTNPLVDGKQMRDTVVLMKLENDSVEHEWLNFILINQIESR